MSCNDTASILDNHRVARLAPAERAAVDEHLAACADCAAAWHAQTQLLALPLPPVPAALLERALLASRTPQRAPRRARVSLVVGGALLVGAALAGVTLVTLNRPPAEPRAAGDGAAAAPIELTAPSADREPVVPSASTPRDEHPTSVELVETALSIAPLTRLPPRYPPDALAKGLEGHVQLKFDVTAAGVVENVRVVESSDAQFEASASEALGAWRYLPRIAAGRRVRSEDVQTIIRFALHSDTQRPDPRTQQEREAAMREQREYSAALEVALDRLAADELRGAELQLDETQALYGAERTDLWNFYGYLYTVQGDYARAIDAYEKAIAIARQSGFSSGAHVPLANLYFARHQYDVALRTLLQSNLPGGNRVLSPEANALLQKLAALGVTEETVR